MWRIFSKDRQSMNIKTIENVLRLHSDQDYSPQHYDHAIELFLSEYPDGTVRKGKRRVNGTTTFKKRPKIQQNPSQRYLTTLFQIQMIFHFLISLTMTNGQALTMIMNSSPMYIIFNLSGYLSMNKKLPGRNKNSSPTSVRFYLSLC